MAFKIRKYTQREMISALGVSSGYMTHATPEQKDKMIEIIDYFREEQSVRKKKNYLYSLRNLFSEETLDTFWEREMRETEERARRVIGFYKMYEDSINRYHIPSKDDVKYLGTASKYTSEKLNYK